MFAEALIKPAYFLFADCREESRVLQKTEDGAGVAHGERNLPEQEAGNDRGQRHAETHSGDALQPAGQHLEVLHGHFQNAGMRRCRASYNSIIIIKMIRFSCNMCIILDV